ncbi:MAG: DUF1549 and DUF1553 domain-containing protein [Gemmataceae bacterium]
MFVRAFLPHRMVWSLGVLVCFSLLAPAADYPDPPLTNKDRSHWSFKKLDSSKPPKVRDSAWVRNGIDAFILSKLEHASLKPSAAADRPTLLRRVTFDLTGLPPTPEEIDAFCRDTSADAYAKVVDRLLASPFYGERWAQHWLDIARYADSNGYELDAERPHAWRYRDYVIEALNADKPYDRFLTEQLAGDLLARDKKGKEKSDLLVAAGFNRCGPVHLVSGNIDPEESRHEVLTEMTGAVGSVFLGLTIGCARCHDHKFDPISQGDYYRLQAFFAASQPKETDIATPAEKEIDAKKRAAVEGPLAKLQKQISDIEAPCRMKLTEVKKAALEPAIQEALAVEAKNQTPEQKKLVERAKPLLQISWDEVLHALTPVDRERRAKLRAELHKLEAQLPPPLPQAWTLEEGSATPTYLLKRGNFKNKRRKVAPAYPRVLCETPSDAPVSTENTPTEDNKSSKNLAQPQTEQKSLESADRLALAKWLTNPSHPLTAKVLVNRLWQHHFGKGLVRTPNDFGLRGESPTHPELLDWLAKELIDHRWSMKHMHRIMVLSNTYQQSSKATPAVRQLDPENRLVSRMNRIRLEGETIRDAMLKVTGELNPGRGGSPIRVPLEPEVYDLIFTEGEPDNLWPVDPDPRQHARRSIYLFAKRNVHLPLLETFDQPDTLSSCPVRPTSTFAPQALIMLNGAFVQERSQNFALRLLKDAKNDHPELIRAAYRWAFGREPHEREIASGTSFLTEQTALIRDLLQEKHKVATPKPMPAGVNPADAGALVDFCLALLNTNEFIYID